MARAGLDAARDARTDQKEPDSSVLARINEPSEPVMATTTMIVLTEPTRRQTSQGRVKAERGLRVASFFSKSRDTDFLEHRTTRDDFFTERNSTRMWKIHEHVYLYSAGNNRRKCVFV